MVASRQGGLVTWPQLERMGIEQWEILAWARDQYVQRILPGVYSVGHNAPSLTTDLWAAVLYAGPGAMLSHTTAGYWLGIVDAEPRVIHVSTPRQIGSRSPIKVHGRRTLDRVRHRDIPTTSIPQTLIDLAAISDERTVHRALAQLDYRRQLDLVAIQTLCGHGKAGSRRLRVALESFQPLLADTNGRLEEDFLLWCERAGLPLPKLNVWLHGIKVDAYWPDRALVVELDGAANHAAPSQMRRDRRNDLKLRAQGLAVLRYDWSIVHAESERVYEELRTRVGDRSAVVASELPYA
jgi:hypothetical protein